MEHDKICAWLGLANGAWPPNHYCLLGLKPGEGNVALIEQHVHERLAKLRAYQLSHPEQATEAMNRLAQAFMCLSDPEAKKAYDARHGMQASAANTVPPKSIVNKDTMHAPVADDTAVGPKTQVDWKQTPPPVRTQAMPVAVVPPQAEAASSTPVPLRESPASAGADLVAQPADVVYNRAQISFEARRGLTTFQAFIDRIDQTRKLLVAWDKAGRYLNWPHRRLRRATDQHNLGRRLQYIGDAMEGFPQLLGRPGQPGYRVVAMARLEMTATMFNMLDLSQREALARDWLAGRVVLLEHRKFLLQEFKARRRVSRIRRWIWSARAFVNDHPDRTILIVILTLAAAALCYSFL